MLTADQLAKLRRLDADEALRKAYAMCLEDALDAVSNVEVNCDASAAAIGKAEDAIRALASTVQEKK